MEQKGFFKCFLEAPGFLMRFSEYAPALSKRGVSIFVFFTKNS